ncbi:RNA-binding protein [Brevundimonas sp.]|jgi:predicted RNA-binding protein YlxR (DUF448 family)|uniref:RNA-binding protein n=1 Tax=Brevundimonas sp. TaxID=1871086 RepID=UPI003784E206
MSLRDATSDRERRDLVTHQVMDESRLIRFVAAPDGSVAPDLGRKLPGRGMWVAADRASVEMASKKNLFSRSAKTRLNASADLAATVETLLFRRCLDQLGLARREGVLISGFEKSAAAIRAGKAAWVIEASDGSSDGRGKLLALARHQTAKVCGMFSADDLSLALGLENAIHAVLLHGGRADRWTVEVERLAGFRPLRPSEWDQDGPQRGTETGHGSLSPESGGAAASGSDEDPGHEPPGAFGGRGSGS